MLAVRDEVAEPAFQFVSYADFVPRAIAAVGIRVTPIKYERRKVTDSLIKKNHEEPLLRSFVLLSKLPGNVVAVLPCFTIERLL